MDNSRSTKAKRRTSNHATNKKERKKKKIQSSTKNKRDSRTVLTKNKKGASKKSKRKVRMIDRVDSWKEDLLPLKQFLDDNCPVQHPDCIDKIIDFLAIVLKEGRLPVMVTMIRCIRNRQDEWSAIEIIERIARTMNRMHIEKYGAGLDVGWLMGTTEA